jgi:hypothetical protein
MHKVRFAVLGALALGVLLSLATTVSAARSGRDREVRPHATVLEWDTMAPVTGPYVGAPNPIRGIAGGGIPWKIESARGELEANGDLEVRVRGLVLAAGANINTNPVATFRAVVSCQTISGSTATVTNVLSDAFPADTEGNAKFKGHLNLPRPCIAPIVFVVNGTPTPPAIGGWFAATGVE